MRWRATRSELHVRSSVTWQLPILPLSLPVPPFLHPHTRVPLPTHHVAHRARYLPFLPVLLFRLSAPTLARRIRILNLVIQIPDLDIRILLFLQQTPLSPEPSSPRSFACAVGPMTEVGKVKVKVSVEVEGVGEARGVRG